MGDLWPLVCEKLCAWNVLEVLGVPACACIDLWMLCESLCIWTWPWAPCVLQMPWACSCWIVANIVWEVVCINMVLCTEATPWFHLEVWPNVYNHKSRCMDIGQQLPQRWNCGPWSYCIWVHCWKLVWQTLWPCEEECVKCCVWKHYLLLMVGLWPTMLVGLCAQNMSVVSLCVQPLSMVDAGIVAKNVWGVVCLNHESCCWSSDLKHECCKSVCPSIIYGWCWAWGHECVRGCEHL